MSRRAGAKLIGHGDPQFRIGFLAFQREVIALDAAQAEKARGDLRAPR